MALLKVAHLGHPVLRRRAKAVSPRALGSPAVQRFIDDLVETMREYDGVGLAAPQVHESIRIAVYEIVPGDARARSRGVPLTVLVNPELRALSDRMEEDWEGCLSLPDLRGRVPRHVAVEVRALDRSGRPLRYRARGFHARVLQHECDHLDGIVYLDRMRDLRSLSFLPEFERWGAADGTR